MTVALPEGQKQCLLNRQTTKVIAIPPNGMKHIYYSAYWFFYYGGYGD